MSNILVVGGSGFLGQSLARFLGDKGLTTYNSHPRPNGIKFDASKMSFRQALTEIKRPLSHIVVTYGAINPELCARDPEGTARLNVTSVIDTMRTAMDVGITPVFLSTDYVFDGIRGERREDEQTCPTTEYGRQKVAVEDWLQTTKCPWIVVRTSKLVSGARDTHSVLGQWVNEIMADQEMRCAEDQIFSPAFVDDVAQAIISLATVNAQGIFHVAGERAYSRYDLADTLVKAIKKVDRKVAPNLKRAKLAEFPFLERRPLNTSLAVDKFRSLNLLSFRSMDTLCEDVARSYF